MSVSMQNISQGIAPSVLENFKKERTQAEKIIQCFSQHRKDIPAENIHWIAQKCFHDVAESFSQESYDFFEDSLCPLIKDLGDRLEGLREQIELTKRAASPMLNASGERMEIIERVAACANFDRYPSENLTMPCYRFIFDIFDGDQEKIQQTCSQLTRTTRWAVQDWKQIDDQAAAYWQETKDEIDSLVGNVSPESIAQFLNSQAELYKHLSSFALPPPIEMRFSILSATTGILSSIKKLYPKYDSMQVLKTILTQEIACNIKEGDDFETILMSKGSLIRFNILAENEIPPDLLRDTEVVRALAALTDQDLLAIAKMLRGERELQSQNAGTIETIRLFFQKSSSDPRLMQYMRYIATHPEQRQNGEFTAVATWYVSLHLQPERLSFKPGQHPLHSCFPWMPKEIDLIKRSLIRFNILAENQLPTNLLHDTEVIRALATLTDQDLLAIAKMLRYRLRSQNAETIETIRLFFQKSSSDPRLMQYMRYIATHPEQTQDEDFNAVTDWYVSLHLQPERLSFRPGQQPLRSSFPWTHKEVDQIIGIFGNNEIDWGRFRR